MSLGTVGMAKKTPKGKPARPPEPEPKRNIFSVRGTEAWRDWVTRLAAHNRVKVADLFDHALVAYAKQTGFADPPPER